MPVQIRECYPCQNRDFPLAKLARQLRCAALAVRSTSRAQHLPLAVLFQRRTHSILGEHRCVHLLWAQSTQRRVDLGT